MATGDGSRSVLGLLWFVVGAAMVLVPGWLAFSRGETLLAGHPMALAVAIACLLLGFVALAWSVATLVLPDRSDTPGGRRSELERVRRARRRVALGVPALFVCVLVVAALAWSRPLPATSTALNAMRSGNDVRVADRLTWYEMVPGARDVRGTVTRPRTGLIFVPGARVDPRAYAHLLRPLADAGYLVAVLKEPFGFALSNIQHPRQVIAAHPEIVRWVVGGHSVGGVAAAAFAQDREETDGAPVVGLVLYASYPAQKVDRSGLAVTSISGELDGLTTPEDIDDSKDDLPADTSYVVVPGAVHSYFGDYGNQAGDGTPTADRTAAQAEITKATLALLAAVTPKAKKK